MFRFSHRLSFRSLGLFASFVLPAAAGCNASSASTETETASADVTSGGDVSASNCEAFVDRANVLRSSHGLVRVRLFLKTLNDRLAADGGIAEVGMRAKMTSDGPCNGAECQRLDVFHDYAAVPFVGAGDYFELDFVLKHDNTAPRTFEGAFYVRTASGKTLWVNPAGAENFALDQNLANDIERLRGLPPGFIAAGPETAVVTADKLPYLNPGLCR
jgi:hypothetical protein